MSSQPPTPWSSPPSCSFKQGSEVLPFLCDNWLGQAPAHFALQCWDGQTWHSPGLAPLAFHLVIKDPYGLRRLLLAPTELGLAEAYIYGSMDIEGDIFAALAVADYLRNHTGRWADKLRLWAALAYLPVQTPVKTGRQAAHLSGLIHSKERDRQAISYHYDLSNDFYALWLGDQMVYSCAYFVGDETASDALERAQEHKLDYICRKLRLHAGERFLDVGCGWGALVMHAARHYGVTSVGITLSQQQAAMAQARIEQAGLSERCQIVLGDYRDLNGQTRYDKIASIGMAEHVASEQLAAYYRRIWSLLRPGGLFLNQAIASVFASEDTSQQTLINRYIFPDAQLVPVAMTEGAAESAGLEVRDVECLREHYEKTLRHWLRRLEARHQEAVSLVGEAAYRTWRLFLAGSAMGFQQGRIKLYQCLYAKAEADGGVDLPMTRADLYV